MVASGAEMNPARYNRSRSQGNLRGSTRAAAQPHLPHQHRVVGESWFVVRHDQEVARVTVTLTMTRPVCTEASMSRALLFLAVCAGRRTFLAVPVLVKEPSETLRLPSALRTARHGSGEAIARRWGWTFGACRSPAASVGKCSLAGRSPHVVDRDTEW